MFGIEQTEIYPCVAKVLADLYLENTGAGQARILQTVMDQLRQFTLNLGREPFAARIIPGHRQSIERATSMRS